MKPGDRLREDRHLSCRVLADLITRAPPDFPNLRWLLRDFRTKAEGLPVGTVSPFVPAILSRLLPEEDAPLVKLMTGGRPEPRGETRNLPRFDVALITVMNEELVASKIAFDVQLNRDEDYRIGGYRYWRTSIRRKNGKSLDLLLTMAGERNVQCAIACERLFTNFNVGCCFLVGIGGGHRKYVKLGDVVASELVLDYEGARMEPGTRLRRPHVYEPDYEIYQDLMHFDPIEAKWPDTFQSALGRLRAVRKIAEVDAGWQPTYQTGVILAGEKFLADGSVPTMGKDYHERARAADMEGSGFARSCKGNKKPWLVFRGVSDFGEKKRKKGWKLIAALSAATAVHAFLTDDYRPIDG